MRHGAGVGEAAPAALGLALGALVASEALFAVEDEVGLGSSSSIAAGLVEAAADASNEGRPPDGEAPGALEDATEDATASKLGDGDSDRTSAGLGRRGCRGVPETSETARTIAAAARIPSTRKKWRGRPAGRSIPVE